MKSTGSSLRSHQPEGSGIDAYGRKRGCSRSHSRSRHFAPHSPRRESASASNWRLSTELHTGVLELQRRSSWTANIGNAANIRVGVKTLTLDPNGKRILINSINKNATMRADFINHIKNRPNTNWRLGTLMSGNIVKSFGTGRPTVGGAAERISKRRIQQRGSIRQPQLQYQKEGAIRHGGSRSRSRGPENNFVRSRSRSRGPENNYVRSQSRGRTPSRIRDRQLNRERSTTRVPIKDRLGGRPGGARNANSGRGVAPANRNKRGISRERNANRNGRTIANGRIQSRNDKNANYSNKNAAAAKRGGRRNGRSAVRNAVDVGAAFARRSRSRTRVNGGGNNVQQRLQTPGRGDNNNIAVGDSRRVDHKSWQW